MVYYYHFLLREIVPLADRGLVHTVALCRLASAPLVAISVRRLTHIFGPSIDDFARNNYVRVFRGSRCETVSVTDNGAG